MVHCYIYLLLLLTFLYYSEGKIFLVHAMKAYSWSKGTGPLFFLISALDGDN